MFNGQPGTGLNHCALDNENEDDDEYEEERCMTPYSSSILAYLRSALFSPEFRDYQYNHCENFQPS
jgi:hypothetical protein